LTSTIPNETGTKDPKQSKKQLTDTERIEKLLTGLYNLSRIRDILQNHVKNTENLVFDYYRHTVKDKGHEKARSVILQLEARGNSTIDRSEQRLRDLLSFVFAK
jgi:hypothetical protein